MNTLVPPSSPDTPDHAIAAAAEHFRHILCAIDFSESSRAAFDKAVDLARTHHAALTVLHVFEDEAPALAGPQTEHEVTLAEWRIVAERRGAVARAISAGGNACDLIVTRAREFDHDLVVIGAHGRTEVVHEQLGSIAEQVVRHAHCSVLVVRPRGTHRRPHE